MVRRPLEVSNITGIASWIAGALDPVDLAHAVKMDPDPWQAQVLRSTAPYLHLNCSRQVGKSTVTALVAVHKAVYMPNAVVLIISPSERQSIELFRKVQAFYQSLGKPIETLQANAHQLTLENGSRILSVPGSPDTVRGFTPDLILMDEAAFVDDALYTALSPMLAISHGRLIAMSTPNGKRGWWYEASPLGKGRKGWAHIVVPAYECARLDKKWLDEERGRIGDLRFRQEYLCQFVDAAGATFTGEDVTAFFTAEYDDTDNVPQVQRGALSPDHLATLRSRAQRNDRLIGRTPPRTCQHRWKADSLGFHCAMGCGAVQRTEGAR